MSEIGLDGREIIFPSAWRYYFEWGGGQGGEYFYFEKMRFHLGAE